MPTILKSTTADFSSGAGHNASAFVAQTDLLLAYDYSNFSNWKTGLVAGQTATSYLLDYVANTTTPSDSGFQQSLNGRGVRINTNGYVTLGYSMPQFSNTDGVGRTFMTLSGVPSYTPTGSTWVQMLSAGWDFSSAGVLVGESWVASPGRSLGSAVQTVAFNPVVGTDLDIARANLIILRATGAGSWDLVIPNLRAKYSQTDAQMGVSNPVAMSLVPGAPGAVHMGNSRNNSQLAAREFDAYANAIWGRALTDAEIAQQYQRLRLRFGNILN